MRIWRLTTNKRYQTQESFSNKNFLVAILYGGSMKHITLSTCPIVLTRFVVNQHEIYLKPMDFNYTCYSCHSLAEMIKNCLYFTIWCLL